MSITALLQQSLDTGQPVRIVYEAGSQPGTLREIVTIKIDGDTVTAHCVASKTNKTFKLAAMRMPTEVDVRAFDPAFSIHAVRDIDTVDQVIGPAAAAIRDRGWVLEFDQHSAGAFRTRKNGARLKHPNIFIFYSAGTQRPYYVRSDYAPPASSFRSGHDAARRFVEFCMAARPEDKPSST